MKNFDSFTLTKMIEAHNSCKERFPTVAALLEAAIKEAQELYFQDQPQLTSLEQIWLRQGDRMKVVKSVKSRSEWSILQAKELVDRFDGDQTTIEPTDHELNAAEKDALRAGNKIQAVKLLKDRTGLSLMDAKRIVDAYNG